MQLFPQPLVINCISIININDFKTLLYLLTPEIDHMMGNTLPSLLTKTTVAIPYFSMVEEVHEVIWLVKG